MAEQLAINVTRAATATPAVYTVPGAVAVEPLSAFAHFDGTGAAVGFRPALTFYSDAGLIIARVFPGDSVAAGDTADVTFAPFLGAATAATGGASPVASTTFAPVGGFTTVTNTNLATPQTIVTSPSFTADGVTAYRVDFSLATIDIAVGAGGTGAALILTLIRDSTIIGLVGDWNAQPTAGFYMSAPCFVSVFDTPTAGNHTYTIGATKSLGGATTATMRLYGSNIGPPFTTETHPGYLAVYG